MKIRFLSFIILILTNVGLTTGAFATELSFLHKPVAPALLPPPGRPLTLELLIPKIKDLSLKVRAEVIIDNQVLDVTLDGTLDENDRTFYRTTIRAPISDLAYRFHISGAEDKNISSEEYRIVRPCTYDQKLTDTTIAPDLAPVQLARELVRVTKGLEKDISDFSEVVEVLKAIEEETR